jgi:microsomal epoxide hydrolase
MAFRLFALFALGALLIVQAATNLAAAHDFRSSDGVRLHYTANGKGEVIVLVPGWTMPASIWAPQIEHFSQRYRVVAFDPRSQGDSAIARSGHNMTRRSQDIAELIAHLKVPRVVLVGWSLAVLEALNYVHAQGDAKVAGLVLVDNSVGEDPAPQRGGNFMARLQADREKAMTEFVREMFRSQPAPEYLDALTAQALRTPYKASVQLLTIKQPREFWRAAVYATAKPVLYVVTPRLQGQAENLQRKRPATRTAVFADAGHALFVDDAARFNALMDEFLGDVLR